VSPSDRSLRRHLWWVVIIKLILIFVLWWCFFRDAEVPVGPDSIARQFAPNPTVKGEQHGQ